MKIRIAGWKCTGMRCPDLSLSFDEGGKIPRVLLIQMPNGTGKTTTLNLIRAAMTGAARQWSPEFIRTFREPGASNEIGTFVLRLLVDETPLVFDLTFDFIQGAVSYRTSSPSLGGVVDGWDCGPSVKRFLTEGFTSLFVFDGEFANRLLDSREAEAEHAIDALCQLDLLDRTVLVAEADWQEKVRGQGAKTAQGLAIYRRRERSLLEREQAVMTALKRLESEHERVSAETQTLSRSIEDRISASEKHRAKYERLIVEVQQKERNLLAASLSTMMQIRRPHFLSPGFAGALTAFRQSLDRARLPELSSKQFFLDLVEDTHCICGHEIGPAERDSILRQATRYMGDDISGVINSIKSAVGEALAATDSTLEHNLNELAAARNTFHTVNTELEALKAEALKPEQDTALRTAQETIRNNEQKLREWQDQMEEMTRAARSTDDENTFCLASLKKQLLQVREKIAEISGTVELRAQTDVISRIADQAKAIARERIRKKLLADCNARLQRILAGNPVYLGSIGRSLELQAQSGASMGQTLAVGYTFLASVLHRGAHEFPLIVDSPAGPLDDLVRSEIGSMVPELCAQFLAFMISTERDHFLPALERTAGLRNIRYLTIFRKTEGTRTLLSELPTRNVTQTDNGVVVDGRDYFVQFKLTSYSEPA